MIALALILTLLAVAALTSWLAGLATRGTVTACNQRCRQRRECSCADVETQP